MKPSPTSQEHQEIIILTPEEMRQVRLQGSIYARTTLSRRAMHAMMRKNGSVPSPNPWYSGRKNSALSSK